MMHEIEDKLKNIQYKLGQLQRKYAVLVKENEGLKKELETSRASSESIAANMATLQHQLDIAKFGNTQMDAGEKKEFEKKINGYIKQIDKCIALLST